MRRSSWRSSVEATLRADARALRVSASNSERRLAVGAALAEEQEQAVTTQPQRTAAFGCWVHEATRAALRAAASGSEPVGSSVSAVPQKHLMYRLRSSVRFSKFAV